MSDRVININELPLDDDTLRLRPCSSVALLGRRGTGKTTWGKRLLGFLRHDIKRFVVICGNKENMHAWAELVGSSFVVLKNLDYLKKLRDYQMDKVVDGKVSKKHWLCIVTEDCGSDRKYMNSEVKKDLQANGRHYGITQIDILQFLYQLVPENRDQIDYLGVLRTANEDNIKRIQKEFVSLCDLRTFKYVLTSCTIDYGMCWIDNTLTPSKIEDHVFFARSAKTQAKPNKVNAQYVLDYGTRHFFAGDPPCPVVRDDVDTDSDDERPKSVSVEESFQDARGTVCVRRVRGAV
jgi:energy-coupling factor transporter ATP-binding protein EcfA2